RDRGVSQLSAHLLGNVHELVRKDGQSDRINGQFFFNTGSSSSSSSSSSSRGRDNGTSKRQIGLDIQMVLQTDSVGARWDQVRLEIIGNDSWALHLVTRRQLFQPVNTGGELP
ncbi:hypothetical protein WICPIJ_002107, partial [Wickerhamomyces pijperi]